MDKYDEYLEAAVKTEKTSQHKKHRKLLIPAIAAITALATAGAAIAVSAAPSDEADGKVMLNVAEAVESQDEQTPVSGYLLTDVSDVVEEVLPSVVSITSRTIVDYFGGDSYPGSGDFGEFFDYFFGDSWGSEGGRSYRSEVPEEEQGSEESEPQEIDAGMGSGTIIGKTDEELLILTSYHVVEGSSSLYVTFFDDTNVDGTIKAADADKDIAVVAIPLEDIEQETLDNIKIATICSEEPKVGDGCIVIGNALGYGTSVTTGIISALNREIYVEGQTLTVIQTDAAINNGNSGGCMLNSKGELIGINEAKVYSSLVEGMCYAIPVADNMDLIEDLMNGESHVDEDTQVTGSGAFLGINGRDVSDDLMNDFGMPKGVYVYNTVPGGGAENAGIMSGDIIVGIDEAEVTSFEELQYELSLHDPGDVVTMVINRLVNGSYVSMTMDVTLTERIS